MAGILYLCATPIGNLEDITLRVLRTLQEADLIAAEDTRNSRKLLNHFEIDTPMTSYHEYNKFEKGEYLIQELKNGRSIALITDAGTPGISDPGEELVRMCYEEGLEVTSLPGAAACITGLTLSGLSTRRFVFEGFLPGKKKDKEEVLNRIGSEVRTMIFYEAPHRLVRTLEELGGVLGERNITVLRELTKKYETVYQTTFSEAVSYYTEHPPRGECVIVIEGKNPGQLAAEQVRRWEEMTIEAHLEFYEAQGVEHKDAMRRVAKDRGISRRDVYQYLLSL